MSNKYITYGKGNDIDPEVIDRVISQTALVYVEEYEMIYRALQQREERIQRAKEWAVMCSDNEPSMEHLIQILEGTDGE